MSHTRADRQRALTIVLDWAADAGGKSLTERELVHGLVEHFANDGALWGPLLAEDPNITGRGIAMPTKMFVEDAEVARLRDWFRGALAQIAESRIRGETRDRVVAGRDRIAQVGKHYLPESPEAALAFVLHLLLDEAKGYGADLRACQLEGCSRFFFISTRPRKGNVGTVPKYCSPEHMTKAHNMVKSAWTKRKRDELKKAKLAAAGKLKAKRKR